jgi:hypothetical protein
MKPPKNVKQIVAPKNSFGTTELQSNRLIKIRKEIFPLRFLRQKKVFKHALNKLMDAFIHLIRETELNIKIYRTLNHERVLPNHKHRNCRANQSSLN